MQSATSPLDGEGHGTPTSSTAAGNFVEGANLLGNANGTAVGIAPRAHMAMYRVCDSGCKDSDILVSLDAAIKDGVDVISISLGTTVALPLYSDVLAIGSYSVISKGIFVSASTRNLGPNNCTVINGAPWIFNVAPSTTDQKISAVAMLGNGVEYKGESVFQPTNFSQNLLSLVNGDSCLSLSTDVKDVRVLPATHVTYGGGQKILKYINSTSAPVATISLKGTRIEDKYAPTIAYFSVRGPFRISRGILKPDISAPGVNILAVWTSTSATASKSTIITTANLVNLDNNPIQDEILNLAAPFSMGSGHVNPSRATDPRLIYDIHPEDYVSYLCGLKYTDQQVSNITKRKVHCTSSTPESKLNYPLFSVTMESAPQTFTRTVTNVGEVNQHT
ncbi:hypothetical protein CQW23_15569 [Capsicum baccatum]|uniref:Peptidase S8/S53 domain-containing protein n=1 Tax=Capsicum baccatum TaxID=33114 RepID=A0A2G2WMG4_CAPBA|nr:hypothetical protein CQW23_15569 [Capsicum baccatum]